MDTQYIKKYKDVRNGEKNLFTIWIDVGLECLYNPIYFGIISFTTRNVIKAIQIVDEGWMFATPPLS